MPCGLTIRNSTLGILDMWVKDVASGIKSMNLQESFDIPTWPALPPQDQHIIDLVLEPQRI